MSAREPREITLAEIEQQFELASYWFGAKWCPAVDKTAFGYRIRVLKSETAPAPGTPRRPGMTTTTELEQALAELGNTADEIAAALIAKGMRGSRKVGTCCPIANYLSVTFAAPEVTENSIAIGRVEDPWIETPNHVREFITRFDGGEWPELDIDRLELG